MPRKVLQNGQMSFRGQDVVVVCREGHKPSHGAEAWLAHLALIVRGADTAPPDIGLEAAGLAAMSLGQSRMFADDLEQLDAAMLIYDAV